jgi:hypothetical protein
MLLQRGLHKSRDVLGGQIEALDVTSGQKTYGRNVRRLLLLRLRNVRVQSPGAIVGDRLGDGRAWGTARSGVRRFVVRLDGKLPTPTRHAGRVS